MVECTGLENLQGSLTGKLNAYSFNYLRKANILEPTKGQHFGNIGYESAE